MEVLAVTLEDEELVRLFFDDLFDSSLKSCEYLAERHSLLLHFSRDADLQKALAEKTYTIDDGHVYTVQKFEAAVGQRPKQKAAAAGFVKPTLRRLPLQQQQRRKSMTSPVQDAAACEFQSDRFDRPSVSPKFVRDGTLEHAAPVRSGDGCSGGNSSSVITTSVCKQRDKKGINFDSSEKEAAAGSTMKSFVPDEWIEFLMPSPLGVANLTGCVAVPRHSCGLIIGKGGVAIRDICTKSGAYAHIKAGPSPIPEHRIFEIIGTAEQIECARQHMSRAARMHLPLMESTEVAATDLRNPPFDAEAQNDCSGDGGKYEGRDCRAVEVSSIASSTSRKCLEVYFSDEFKSGGGTVESITYATGRGSALVVFEDPAVASRVAAKVSHVVQGTTVDVRLRESPCAASRKESSPPAVPPTFEKKQPVRPHNVGSGRFRPEVPSSVSGGSMAEDLAERPQKRSTAAGLDHASFAVCDLGAYICAEAIACWLKLATGSWPCIVCYAASAQKALTIFDRADVRPSELLTEFANDNLLNGQRPRLERIAQWSTLQVLGSGGSELEAEGRLKEQFPTADSFDIQPSGCTLVKFASCTDADRALFSKASASARAATGLCIVPYVDEFSPFERDQVFYFDEIRAVALSATPLKVLPQLVVLGIAADISISLLAKFFSNTPKTGGGRIRSFVCNSSRAVITYVQAEDCHKVVNASKAGLISFCDRRLRVAIKSFQADGHHKDRVLLRNLGEASLDEIKYLVWATGGCPVRRVEFVRVIESSELCALVLLGSSSSSDFGRLSHGLQALTLNGATLELDFVPISCSIIVKNVPASAHRDLVELACSADGRVVQSCEPFGAAAPHDWKVTFAHPTDAERAASKPIVYDSRTALEVAQYATYRPLAESLADGRARRELLLPTFAAATVLRFVLDRRPPGLDDLLARHGCACAFLPGGVGAEPVAAASLARPPWDPAYGRLRDDWPRLRLELASYLHDFAESSVTASAAQLACTDERLLSALTSALDGIDGMGAGGSSRAMPAPLASGAEPVEATLTAAADGGRIVRCVGSKVAVGRLKDRLRAAIDGVRYEAEKRRTLAAHTEADVEPWLVELLAGGGFQGLLRERGIDVQVAASVAQCEVTLIGAKPELDKARQVLAAARRQAFTERQQLACAALYRLLSKDGVRADVERALTAEQLGGKALWLLEPPGALVVRAVNLVSAKKAADCIKRQLSFRAMRVPGDSKTARTAVDVGEWKQALQLADAGIGADELELELAETAADGGSSGDRDLIVACKASAIDRAEREIRRLLSRSTVVQRRYWLHPLAAAYLADNVAVVRSVQDAHSRDRVTASLDDGGSSSNGKGAASPQSLTIEGNVGGVAAFVSSLKSRLSLAALTSRTYLLSEPGAAAYFASASAAEALQAVAKATGTVVKLGDEASLPAPPPPTSVASSSHCCADGDGGGSSSIEVKTEYLLPDGGMTLCARRGSMVGVDCCAMVSSTDEELSHSSALASAIAEAGGDAVVKACRIQRLRLGMLSEGDVVVTAPGRLPCKLLLHAVVPVWHEGVQDEEVKLRRAVSGCLRLCDERQLSSVALPALGCGSGGYPPEQAVAAIVDEVRKYVAGRPSGSDGGSSVSTITFVDVDGDRVRQFCSAIESAFGVSPARSALAESLYIGISRRSSKSLVLASIGGGTGGTESPVAAAAVEVEHVSTEAVDLIAGSLEDQTADVLVAPVAADLDLARGRVSAALSKAAGPALELELKKNNPHGIPEGRLAITSAHALHSSQLVFFVRCPEAGHHTDSQERLRRLILECLQEAEQRGKRSIALPALGTGHGHFMAAAAAAAMTDAVDDYGKKNPASKLRILVVVGDPRMMADYRQRLASVQRMQNAAASVESRGGGRGTEAFFWKTQELQAAAEKSSADKSKRSAVLFTICGTSKSTIAKAATQIGEHCLQHMHRCSITKPKDIVGALSKSQFEAMQSYGRRKDVGVSLEVANGEAAITLRSLDSRSMLDAMQLFNEALVVEHVTRSADEELLRSVRWRYKDTGSGEWRDYCASLNRRLEDARKAKQLLVRYRSGGYSCDHTVDLDRNRDECVQLAEATTEIRRDEVSSAIASYPATWSPSQSYLEVTLKEQSPEYAKVHAAFIDSLQQSRQVLAIMRIQNPPLWQQYAALRRVVEEHVSSQNEQQVERFLWHGAPADTIKHICCSRFDRSHSGKNAVAYGQGVYFARDARYSAQDLYSVQNRAGEKHVIYCQVLTGDFEMGNQNMRVPNIKPGQTMVRYDSTVDRVSNPSIFVTYHDAQAYPAYVIKFL